MQFIHNLQLLVCQYQVIIVHSNNCGLQIHWCAHNVIFHVASRWYTMWNESIKHEVIPWMKRNCHSQGRKSKILNDIIIYFKLGSSLEEYLWYAHCEVGVCVTTKEYICSKCNPTKKIIRKRRWLVNNWWKCLEGN